MRLCGQRVIGVQLLGPLLLGLNAAKFSTHADMHTIIKLVDAAQNIARP
jgi:hypothetical protein